VDKKKNRSNEQQKEKDEKEKETLRNPVLYGKQMN
jgi:hypothetical protein